MNLRNILTSAAFSVGLVLNASVAVAHGKGMMTMPSNGQTVGTDTKVMHLMFTDPMQITIVKMKAPDGNTYQINGPAANKAVKTWEGSLPELAPGNYQIDWRGMSSDGHAMNGSFAFSVAN
ncbi:putative copper resistance protein CopC [Phaeobacter piscinae]|uniref:Copper resistance protein CopC n=1 Tax=Phaeobacter piscinae TaxID=1580596 RepID=A0ABM6PE86_9RHOB|nr:copper resistance CopC family protein [Phaeobacter piscinae]ATG35876.1 putative copper resistance protein CopC [Phaeobacter piscinae]AUQ86397.1 putative copper resistance protein CopC [Phaeobacter piscinae]AUR24280.1 putative copper resistance protein CopC [Phaeobacter piscinae]